MWLPGRVYDADSIFDYRSIYSRASLVNIYRSRKVRVTSEIQREMLCGKKDLSLLKFSIYIGGGKSFNAPLTGVRVLVRSTHNPDYMVIYRN